MSKKIVITGAAGFIGSNLLAELEERGYEEIVAVDWLGNEEKWRNIAKRCFSFYLPPEKLIDYIRENEETIKSIVHLGGYSSTLERDGDAVLRTNYNLSLELFDFCVTRNISFIYASSAATYGAGENGFKDYDDFENISKLRPLNLYGWSKKQVDLYISKKGGFKRKDSQVVGLRFFNVYGPNEYHKGNQRSVIEPFENQLLSEGTIKLFKSFREEIEDGNQARDFIYVSDCVDVIIWFLEHESVSGLFNVGTGNPSTYNEVAKHISEAVGKPGVIEYIEMPERLKSQYQNYTRADISKLRNVGYAKEMIPIKGGIRDYIANYLMQKDKYR